MRERGKDGNRGKQEEKFAILINNINNNIACLHEKLIHVHEFIRMIEKVSHLRLSIEH